MSTSDIIGIVGIVLAIIGLGYAVYQSREKKKLEDHVRSQAWYIYSMANNVTGIAQASLNTYEQLHAHDLNTQVLKLLAKTETFGQDLFRETIRQIQLSEPAFTQKKIANWVAQGKVDEDHAILFRGICVDDHNVPISSDTETKV